MTKITKILMPLIVGCLLACCLNVMSGSMGYKKVAMLKNPVSSYEGDIPSEDVESVKMMQLLKWNVVPSIFALIIYGGCLYYVTKGKSSSGEEEQPAE